MVAPTENRLLGRFIFSKADFNRTQNLVKPRTFMPPPDLRLSVFDIDAPPVENIWIIGEDVASLRSQTLYARADIKTSCITEHGLSVVIDEPPLRHRTIEGWPVNQKEDQKLLAMQLAAMASLHLPERPTP